MYDDEYRIPARMMGSITRYIENGIPPGSFIEAVICNDLREAVGCADSENKANLPAFVSYFYNKAPSTCWGSPEKYSAWLAGFCQAA